MPATVESVSARRNPRGNLVSLLAIRTRLSLGTELKETVMNGHMNKKQTLSVINCILSPISLPQYMQMWYIQHVSISVIYISGLAISKCNMLRKVLNPENVEK